LLYPVHQMFRYENLRQTRNRYPMPLTFRSVVMQCLRLAKMLNFLFQVFVYISHKMTLQIWPIKHFDTLVKTIHNNVHLCVSVRHTLRSPILWNFLPIHHLPTVNLISSHVLWSGNTVMFSGDVIIQFPPFTWRRSMRRKHFLGPNISRTKGPTGFSFTNHSAKLTGRPVFLLFSWLQKSGLCSNFIPGFRKSGLCVPTLFLASES